MGKIWRRWGHYSLYYRDVEELLAERGIVVDHVTIYRWFTPELIDAARPSRHGAGDRWFVDETYPRVAGRWVYLYRAIDQHGQVIDVFASPRQDLAATRQFFTRALNSTRRPIEVTTDQAPAYPRVIDELVLEACPPCGRNGDGSPGGDEVDVMARCHHGHSRRSSRSRRI